MKMILMVSSAAFLIDLKDIQIFRIFRMEGYKSDEDNFDGLFCCISAKQTLCTDGFLFTSMMIDLVEKLSCANCFPCNYFPAISEYWHSCPFLPCWLRCVCAGQ